MSEIFRRQSGDGMPLSLPDTGSRSRHAADTGWQDSGTQGFLIKSLMEDPETGVRTWLMKVEPGAFSERHAHDEVEQIYVVEGSFYDQEKTYGAGDYIVRAPGAMHTAGSEGGAIVLLFYSPGT